MSEERFKALETTAAEHSNKIDVLNSSVERVCDTMSNTAKQLGELTSEIAKLVTQNAVDGQKWHQQHEINTKLTATIERHTDEINSIKTTQAVNSARIDPWVGMLWKVAGTVVGLAVIGGLAFKLIGG